MEARLFLLNPAPAAGLDDVFYVSKADGSADGKVTYAAIADVIGGALQYTFAPIAHGHTASSLTDASAAGRALIQAADYAAMRTALGVEAFGDGDKGDITVASAGSAWTIDDGAVVTAKLGANVYREGAIAKPLVANFTWLNQGALTAADTAVGIQVTASGTTSQFGMLYVTPPSTPYTYYARIEKLGASGANDQMGFLVRNSTNSRVFWFGIYQNTLLSQRWTDLNTFSTTGGLGSYSPMAGFPKWLSITNNGTTLSLAISNDGRVWRTIGTETISTFITASGGGSIDQVGIGMLKQTTSEMHVGSFGAVAPG